MIIISHRGNLNGKDDALENNPNHIAELSKVHQVEIDLWRINEEIFLGHDNPNYRIYNNFFNSNLWVHCKNLQAASYMANTNFNWFWHENDKMTITSKGKIWCFPGVHVKNGITVMKTYTENLPEVAGICTDFFLKYV